MQSRRSSTWLRLALGGSLALSAACDRSADGAAAAAGIGAGAIAWDTAALGLDLLKVAGGFTKPVGVRDARDGSGRLFVLEQDGAIRIVPKGADHALETAFLSFDKAGGKPPPHGFTAAGSEQGLLGIAFHPDFKQNGFFFLDYTDAQGDTVIARFRVQKDQPDRADPDSAEVLLRVDQNYANHNAGDLAFGPDGFLYLTFGDGGAGGDPCGHGQTLNPADLVDSDARGHCATDKSFSGDDANPKSRALLGKLLRIDVDHTTPAGENGLCAAHGDGSAPYAIPADNPFAGKDAHNGCDEIWAYGLRNPWRIAFDRENGDLFIGDVGQNRIEEIDLQPGKNGGGRNYGWNRCEGNEAYDTSNPNHSGGACPLPDTNATPRPILTYTHGAGDCSVTGGYRYRGPAAALKGIYFFGDYCTGRVWLARQDSNKWSAALWQKTDASIVSFGEDEAGNLYFVDYGGARQGKGNIRRFDVAESKGR